MVEVNNREEKFNINDMLKRVFLSLQKELDCNHCEIVYAVDKSVPKMFYGNVKIIEKYLLKVFHFVTKISKQSELLVELYAPKEFVYEDSIIFTLKNIKVTEEDKNNLFKSIEHENNVLGAKINSYSNTTLTFHIPFTLAVLGERRHYRLPSKSLLKKNVMIIAESKNIILSVTKMFKYFPYSVDIGTQNYQEGEYDLSQYHLVVIENKLMTEDFSHACKMVQKLHSMKVVILGDMEGLLLSDISTISSSLAKPVTQESIFELIVSVFSDEYDSDDFLNHRKKEHQIESSRLIEESPLSNNPSMETNKVSKTNSFEKKMQDKENMYVPVLNIKLGKKNTKKLMLNYDDELENFFDMFDGSDLYFRQIVNEKSFQKIKEFCVDLEKHSKIIGAESMLKFTEMISLVFVYKKIDLLPIYPGRYHIELKKLFKEMERYFS